MFEGFTDELEEFLVALRVDEDALVKALESGHLAGAALDVFVREPLPGDSHKVLVDSDIDLPFHGTP